MARPLHLWRVAPLGDHGIVDRVAEASGRWHRGRQAIIYASTTPELAAMEALAHLERPLQPYWLIRLDVRHPVETEQVQGLPEDWKQRKAITRALGHEWLESGSSTVLFVPSALVYEGRNALVASDRLRPGHLVARRLRRFHFDRRLVAGANRAD
jgi:RES domain-containing protein